MRLLPRLKSLLGHCVHMHCAYVGFLCFLISICEVFGSLKGYNLTNKRKCQKVRKEEMLFAIVDTKKKKEELRINLDEVVSYSRDMV